MTEPGKPQGAPESEHRAVDGWLRELARGAEGDDEAFIERVLTRAGLRAAPRQEIHRHVAAAPEAKWPWLWGRRFWLATAAAVVVAGGAVALQVSAVLGRVAGPAEAFVYSQGALAPGLPAVFRVYERDAARQQPLAGTTVAIALDGPGGRHLALDPAVTDSDGMALLHSRLPADLPEGDYRVTATFDGTAGTSTVTTTMPVRRSYQCLVSSDKPLYQPGQTMHLRVLALTAADQRPAAACDVLLEVQDPKGNKVCKQRRQTSAFGLAAADFQLADQVNLGEYQISATLGNTTSRLSVAVERYVLPKFSLELTTDRSFYAPGETARVAVRAVYTFGQPVPGAAVELLASEFVEQFRPLATVTARTDAEGRATLALPLPDSLVGQALHQGDASVQVAVTVVDPAGQKGTKAIYLPVSTRPLRTTVIPESGLLVPGVENLLYVFTAYPDGRAAAAKVRVEPLGKTVETTTAGVAALSVLAPREPLDLTLTAEDRQGVKATATVRLASTPTETLLLRPDRAVYRTGETIRAEVFAATAVGRVFCDVVQNGRTLLTSAADLQQGRATLTLDLPPEWAGTLALQAYRILPGGDLMRDQRVVQVNRADDLRVQATLGRETYRPGESARVDFTVTRATGEPTPAALSLAAVDEAVFALSELQPGLERVYFALQEELLKPRWEVHGEETDEEGIARDRPAPVAPPLAPAAALSTPAPDETPARRDARLAFFEVGQGHVLILQHIEIAELVDANSLHFFLSLYRASGKPANQLPVADDEQGNRRDQDHDHPGENNVPQKAFLVLEQRQTNLHGAHVLVVCDQQGPQVLIVRGEETVHRECAECGARERHGNRNQKAQSPASINHRRVVEVARDGHEKLAYQERAVRRSEVRQCQTQVGVFQLEIIHNRHIVGNDRRFPRNHLRGQEQEKEKILVHEVNERERVRRETRQHQVGNHHG